MGSLLLFTFSSSFCCDYAVSSIHVVLSVSPLIAAC